MFFMLYLTSYFTIACMHSIIYTICFILISKIKFLLIIYYAIIIFIFFVIILLILLEFSILIKYCIVDNLLFVI